MSRTDGTRAGRVGRPWLRVSHQVYGSERDCWLCGEYVDQRLYPQHPRARSADHLIQLQHGGPPLARTNLRLAHLGCNSARSNTLRGLAVRDCACSLGLPCARLNPKHKRGLVTVDLSEV